LEEEEPQVPEEEEEPQVPEEEEEPQPQEDHIEEEVHEDDLEQEEEPQAQEHQVEDYACAEEPITPEGLLPGDIEHQFNEGNEESEDMKLAMKESTSFALQQKALE
jgi:hypothetical protein